MSRGPKFNAALQKLGVDTYMLWGGDDTSFMTPAAGVQTTIAYLLKTLKAWASTGVDLDFEHPVRISRCEHLGFFSVVYLLWNDYLLAPTPYSHVYYVLITCLPLVRRAGALNMPTR